MIETPTGTSTGFYDNPIYQLAQEVWAGQMTLEAAMDQVMRPEVLRQLDDSSIQAINDIVYQMIDSKPSYARMLALLNFEAAQQVASAAVRGHAALNLGKLYLGLGDAKQALRFYDEALRVFRAQGNKEWEAIILSEWGEAYRALGQMERAIEYYERALAISREVKNRQAVGILLNRLGLVYGSMGQMKRAIEHLQQALAISREIGDRKNEAVLLSNLGTIYRDLGQVERAIEYFQQALTISRETGDHYAQGDDLMKLGTAYGDLKQAERAIEYFQQALAISRESPDRRNEGPLLGNLGIVYRDLGQVERAIEHLQQAVAISREFSDRRNEGAWLGNLGNAYRDLGKIDRAIEYYQLALEISREIGNRRGEGFWLSELGSAYLSLEQTEQSVEYFQQALTVSRESSNRQQERTDLGNLGNAYRDLGKIDRAIEYYQKALKASREISDRHGEGTALGSLGSAYGDLGQVDRAIEHLQQAVAISREFSDRRNEGAWLGNLGNAYVKLDQVEPAIECYLQALSIFQETGDADATWRISTELGNTYAERLGDHQQAFAHYSTALNMVEELRIGLEADVYRRDFLRDKAFVYNRAVRSGIQAGKGRQALRLLEQSKTRFLADLLRRRDAVPAHVPSDLRRQYQHWFDEVQSRRQAYLGLSAREDREVSAFQETTRALTPDDQLRAVREAQRLAQARQEEARERLEAARQELERVEAAIREHDPDFGRLHRAGPLTFSQIHALVSADRQTALVELGVTAEGTSAFVVAEGNLEVVWLPEFTLERLSQLLWKMDEAGNPIDGWLVRYFNRYRTSADRMAWLGTIESAADALGAHLWKPIDKALRAHDIKRLLLIPHLALHVLPLHLTSYNVDGQRQRLLDEYEVSYAPSATVLDICQKRAEDELRSSAQGLLAACNPTADLVFTLSEVDVATALFTSQGQTVCRLDIEEATQAAVLREAAGQAYIHFACHGIYDWNDPMASALMLFGGRRWDRGIEPDPLTLAEIQRELDLRSARLVTLSACETGFTDPSDVLDEYVGLPAGFLLAGAPAVVSSLWAVDDFSTALLMEEFYRWHLEDKQGIAAALRGAQLWLRDLTRDAVVERVDRARAKAHAKAGAGDEGARLLWTRLDALREELLEDYGPQDRPFSHPYYWGAFIASGAV